ncbi:MAG: nucleotidyltransferase domain-containing protein [Chloroflexi bacterium]|nr:nucleotidyltransferase domain-containing protein [Chloroflexota bacterium]
MPVRLLNSSVLKWPYAQSVDQSVRRWAEQMAQTQENIQRIGYFGSYARGDWGVGSDLDVIVIVDDSEQPFEKRARQWDTQTLPVPVDILVYTMQEWDSLQKQNRFQQTLSKEAIWIYDRHQNRG